MIYVTPIGGDCSYLERQDFIIYDKNHKIRKKMIDALNKEFSNIGFSFLLGGSIGIGIHPKTWDKTFCLKFLEKIIIQKYIFLEIELLKMEMIIVYIIIQVLLVLVQLVLMKQ